MAGDTPVQINWPYTASLGRIEDKIDALTGAVLTLNRRVLQIMALVQVEQGDLDALDASLDQVAQSLADKIQALIDAAGTPLPEAQLTALNEDVDALRALAAPVPPPAP